MIHLSLLSHSSSLKLPHSSVLQLHWEEPMVMMVLMHLHLKAAGGQQLPAPETELSSLAGCFMLLDNKSHVYNITLYGSNKPDVDTSLISVAGCDLQPALCLPPRVSLPWNKSKLYGLRFFFSLLLSLSLALCRRGGRICLHPYPTHPHHSFCTHLEQELVSKRVNVDKILHDISVTMSVCRSINHETGHFWNF